MQAGADRHASYRFDRFAVDAADERLLGPYGPIKLGNKAFRVLLLLIRKEGKLLTKDELFSSVWDGTTVTESALTSVIKELRRALGDHSRTPRFIESVYGRGYRFVCPVSAATDVAATGGAEEYSKGSAPSAPARTTGGEPGSTELRPVPHLDGNHLEAQHPHSAAGDEARTGPGAFRELRLPPTWKRLFMARMLAFVFAASSALVVMPAVPNEDSGETVVAIASKQDRPIAPARFATVRWPADKQMAKTASQDYGTCVQVPTIG